MNNQDKKERKDQAKSKVSEKQTKQLSAKKNVTKAKWTKPKTKPKERYQIEKLKPRTRTSF